MKYIALTSFMTWYGLKLVSTKILSLLGANFLVDGNFLVYKLIQLRKLLTIIIHLRCEEKSREYMSTNCQKENQMRFVTALFVIRRNTSNILLTHTKYPYLHFLLVETFQWGNVCTQTDDEWHYLYKNNSGIHSQQECLIIQ